MNCVIAQMLRPLLRVARTSLHFARSIETLDATLMNGTSEGRRLWRWAQRAPSSDVELQPGSRGRLLTDARPRPVTNAVCIDIGELDMLEAVRDQEHQLPRGGWRQTASIAVATTPDQTAVATATCRPASSSEPGNSAAPAPIAT